MTASFNGIMLQLRKSGAWKRAGRSDFQVTPANFAQQRARNNALAIGTLKAGDQISVGDRREPAGVQRVYNRVRILV
jgi:hypothetical protein